MEQKRVAPYAEAFRQQMVELIAAGRRPMELAREFGCSDGSIHAWVKKAGRIVDLPRGAHVLQAGDRGISGEHAVREFGPPTEDLNAVADWLSRCRIDTVALESTGV